MFVMSLSLILAVRYMLISMRSQRLCGGGIRVTSERARGRGDVRRGGQEVLLVVVGGADAVYEVITDVLRALRVLDELS